MLVAVLLIGVGLDRPPARAHAPDCATVKVWRVGRHRLLATARFCNVRGGPLIRGLHMQGRDLRGRPLSANIPGPCMDWGNVTMYKGRLLLLGDRILYPLPHRAMPARYPYWVVDLERGTVQGHFWMSLAEAQVLRREKALRRGHGARRWQVGTYLYEVAEQLD